MQEGAAVAADAAVDATANDAGKAADVDATTGDETTDDAPTCDACTCDSPSLSITTPQGAVLVLDQDAEAPIDFAVTGFTLESNQTCNDPTCGEVNMFVDEGDAGYGGCTADGFAQREQIVASPAIANFGLCADAGSGSVTGPHEVTLELHHIDFNPVLDRCGRRVAASVAVTTRCVPDATPQCAGGNSTGICGADGLYHVTPCPVTDPYCLNGTCTACVPGSSKCDGNAVSTCTDTGAWSADTPCGGGSAPCHNGACCACGRTYYGVTGCDASEAGASLCSSGLCVNGSCFEEGSDAGFLCAAAPSGLVAWWPGNGNASDVVGGDDGSFPGTYVAGQVGQAFSIDANDYVTAPDEPALDSANVSVEVWYRHNDALGTSDPIVKKSDPSQTGGFSLEFDSSGTELVFSVYTSSGWASIGEGEGQNVLSDMWIHAVGTYDGTTLNLYLDGVLAFSTPAAAGPIVPASAPLGIGHDPSNPSRYFDGLIDEVSIYNRGLTANEVASLYAAGSAGKCPLAADAGGE